MVSEEFYREYQGKLIQGDRHGCTKMVNELLQSGIVINDLYVLLFQRSLYEIGTLWETNRISVATEHLCTSITESLITQAYPYMFAAEHTGKKAIITCTPGEFHQVGSRMVADYFEMYGWHSHFLGSNTPQDELIRYIKEIQPDALAVSLSVFFNLNPLQKLVKNIRGQFPELPIILGGQGFRWGGKESFLSINKVHIFSSLDELVNNILNPN
jgi:methanogenic corrinoid protein MtbC1